MFQLITLSVTDSHYGFWHLPKIPWFVVSLFWKINLISFFNESTFSNSTFHLLNLVKSNISLFWWIPFEQCIVAPHAMSLQKHPFLRTVGCLLSFTFLIKFSLCRNSPSSLKMTSEPFSDTWIDKQHQYLLRTLRCLL